MKRSYKWAILVGLLFAMLPVRVWAVEYDSSQVILSWTKDNAHSQTITWHSATEGTGYVQYRREGEEFSAENQIRGKGTEVKKGSYYRYEAVISGLSAGTVYEYRVGNGELWSQPMNFTTAVPKSRSSFQFLYLGDVQYQKRQKDYKIWGKLIQDIRQRNPGIAFALLGGDMVNSSKNMKDWNLFLQNASPVFCRIPMMTTIGNHETDVKAELYLKMLALPENGPECTAEEFYSFDYGECHITVLNTNYFLDNRKKADPGKWSMELTEINQWLESDLRKSAARWKIILMHHPAYSISDEDSVSGEIRKNWEPIFERGDVDLALCGHRHLYMRTKEIGGVTYVMGNSGKRRSTYYNGENVPDYGESLDATNSNYQIIRVSDRVLSLESYDEEGQIIDKWTKTSSYRLLYRAAGIGSVVLIAVAALGFYLRVRSRTLRRKK